MHLNINCLFIEWTDFIPALNAGEADAIWCGTAITPERQEKFLFSTPYAIFNKSVLVRGEDNIYSSEDLSVRKVGAISESTNMALAEKWDEC